MKKSYLIALFLLPILLVAGLVSAQTTTKPNLVGQNPGPQTAQTRAEFRQQIEAKQAERIALRAERRATLEETLVVIKDERKQQTALRINDQLQELNVKILNHFSDVLDRQSEILSRVEARVDEIEAGGRNVAQARADITQVESAITAAQAAILAQTAKTYQIQVKTETTLKRDVGTTRQALRQDLETVRTAVKAVHEALRLTVTNLAGIMSEQNATTTWPTATSTN